uniref:Protein spire-like n=1 Tax=Hirondellea gigas TaxID=1518452 RepID=A0A2P2I985_9CRUS
MGDATAHSILDHRGCVQLEKILVRFGAPVSEERAWALCYSSVQCYLQLDSHDKANSALVSSLSHVVLHKDGYVHRDTFMTNGSITTEGAAGKKRETNGPESKMVSELGWVLYSALDYGLGHAEERELAPPLLNLIEQMTNADCERGEADDEGIERDLGRTFNLKDAIQECEKRLTCPPSSITAGGASKKFSSSAKNSPVRTPIVSPTAPAKPAGVPASEHYKAVIHAFVTEAQDLQQFLATVAEGSNFLKLKADLLSSQYDLDQLQCTDWAVLWKQVMLQLREGVKLKKVDYSKTPLEYTLTPYEMLMEDIRSRRFTLNKVTINASIPHKVKKDAHSIILDFIRSRPPLRKASERRLAPIFRVSSPMELLLESIRQDRTLKHIETPVRPKSVVLGRVTSEGALLPPRRKLISAPRITLDIDDDDDDDLSDIAPSSPARGSHYLSGSAPPTMRRQNKYVGLQAPNSTDGPASSQWSRMAYDLATYVSPGGSSVAERRHSICVCETPSTSSPPSLPSSTSSSSKQQQSATARSCRQQTVRQHQSLLPNRSNTMSGASSLRLVSHRTLSATSSTVSNGSSPSNVLLSHSQNQRDFLSSAHFAAHLDCLSLTLEEVVHIRNVLTKADLEALPLDLTIKEDMARGKVCFLCMKVRFSFFGQWSVECRLCKRNVCKKCVSKMRIPTEHFGNIPVLMLTPQALSPRDDEEEQTASLPRQLLSKLQDFPKSASERRVSVTGSMGSAPSSPSTTHRAGPPYSLPNHSDYSPPYVKDDIKRKQEHRDHARSECSPGKDESGSHAEQLRGELMSVCKDCKAMVLHVFLSIRLRRDQHQQRTKTPSPPPPPLKHMPPRHHLHLSLTSVYN